MAVSKEETGQELRHEMLRGVDAVLFDLDGSLVDSMWVWKSIDVEYLGRFGISLPEGLQYEIQGMSFTETAAYFKEHFPIPDSIEKIKADWNRMAWDKYTYEVPLKSGIPKFLSMCKENGIQLGIATSNSRELVENIAGVHKLRDYFTCIVTGCDVVRGKPAPDIYLEAAGRLGLRVQQEPSLPGRMSPKSAGELIKETVYNMLEETEN